MSDVFDTAVRDMEGSAALQAYAQRHGIRSAAVLTVTDDAMAAAIAEYLRLRIEGRVVVEIGGGIGLLALHMGAYAKRVYCIEANPVWTSGFIGSLLHMKPKNVSFLFGAAEEFVDTIRGDVAVYCSHSDIEGMRKLGNQFAPAVIDVYGEVIASAPERFDALARALRPIA